MNMPLGSAYASALEAPPAGPAPFQPPSDAEVLPRTPKDVNPMTQNGDVFFLDPSLFGEKVPGVGEEVLLKASIQSKGSKVGLTPIEVVAQTEEEELPSDEGMEL